MEKINQKLENFILILFIIIILIFSYSFAVKNGWHLSTNESLQFWFSKSIAATISRIDHNLYGYVGFNKIYNFLMNYETINDEILNKAREIKDVSSSGIFTMSELDVGYQDYIYLAFLIFGYSVSSLLNLYFVILILSITLFYLSFRKNNISKIILLIFLLSFLLILPAAERFSYNVGVIYSIRFMTLLAVLPLIHICFFTFNLKKINKNSLSQILSVLMQSIILIFLYYVRTTLIWAFLLLLFFLILNIIFSIIEIRKNNNFKVSAFKIFFEKSKVLVLFFIILFISKIFMEYRLNPIYKERNEGSHVVSHSIYLGLALHPEIRKSYTDERPFNYDLSYNFFCERKFIDYHYKNDQKIKYFVRKSFCGDSNILKNILIYYLKYLDYPSNDQDGFSASFKWLKENGKDEYQLFDIKKNKLSNYKNCFTWFRTHGGAEKFSTKTDKTLECNGTRFLWGKSDKILNGIVKSAIINFPSEVLELTFIIKPLRFIITYFKHYFKSDLKNSLLTFLIFLYCAWLLKKSTLEEIKNSFTILILVLVFSLSISIFTYSNPFIIGAQSLILTMFIYFSIICFLFFLYKKLKLLVAYGE